MANEVVLPDPLAKRDIVFGDKTPPEKLAAYGQAFLEKGQVYDALNCFVQAKAHEEIRKIADIAMEDGDAALLQETMIALKEKAAPPQWKQLAERAESLGKESFAEFAYEQAGEEAKAMAYRQKREQEKFRTTHATKPDSDSPREQEEQQE